MISEETLAKIKRLARLLKESDVTGITVEEGSLKIRVEKQGIIPSMPIPAVKTEEVKESIPKTDEKYIKSPMVGTFYGAASPDASPFVEAGDTVEKGKIVCIVEAMKLFNEIEADKNCKIIKILVEAGKSVEYGQPLFLIEEL